MRAYVVCCGVGVGGQQVSLFIPHAGQASGAVVGVARLRAVGVDKAGDAPCQVVDVLYRPGAGKTLDFHLLDAHASQVVVGVEVHDLGGRVGVGVLLDF